MTALREKIISAVCCRDDGALGRLDPPAQAVREFLDWQALDRGRSPTTERAHQQDLTKFVACCAAVDVGTLGQVDRVLAAGRARTRAETLGGSNRTITSHELRPNPVGPLALAPETVVFGL